MLRNLAVLIVASLAALALAEGVLRLFPGLLTEEAALRLHWTELGQASDEDGGELVAADPDLGFRYLPNRTGHFSRGDFAFTFSTDEHGFRNPSPWPEQAEIVVVGDSMAFGYGVGDTATWTHRVNEALPALRLVNLGMIGTGPQQYLAVLRRHGLGLAPKLVLFMVFPGNDLSDIESFEAWQESGTELDYRRWRMGATANSEAPSVVDLIRDNSYLVAVLRDVRRNLVTPYKGKTIALENGSRLRLAPTAYAYAARIANAENPTFERALELITTAREVTLASGSRFVVLLVPTKEEVYLKLDNQAYPPLVDAFAAALDARGVPHIDLTTAFLAADAAYEPLFFEVDGHPNERGYEVIAETVVALIEELGKDLGDGVANDLANDLAESAFSPPE